MRICAVQHRVCAEREATLCRIESLIGSSAADLYVLPEMFASGFEMDAKSVAEPLCGPTFGWMQQVAKRKDAAVAGSVAVCDGGRYFNRLYFVWPDGTHISYDKRHLFAYSGENLHYSQGSKRVVATYKGVRFLLQICYDLRFPVWSRNVRDYDVAIYVASWPVNRIGVWDLLLQARAVENQCYVVGANRVGDDSMCHYTGHAAIIDPYGRKISECNSEEEAVATAEINMERLVAFREKFPVLSDSDSFSIAGT